MTLRRLNLTLWTTAAALGAGALLCAVLGLALPVEVETAATGVPRPDPAGPTTGLATGATTGAGGGVSLAGLDPIFAAKLRKSLTDAPVAAAPTDTPPPMVAAAGGVPITLVGTIGQSLAMVQTAAGAVEVVSVGESAAGVKVLAIRPSQVDVEYGGQRLTVTKAKGPNEI